MGFFDDMAKKVGSVANEAGSKAKDAASIAKLSAEIGSKEREMARLFSEMGQKMYYEYRDCTPNDIEETAAKIDDIKSLIAELNEKIEYVKNS